MNHSVTSHGIRKGPIIRRPQTMTGKKNILLRKSCPPPRTSFSTQNTVRSREQTTSTHKSESRVSYLNDSQCISNREKLASNLENPDFSDISLNDLKKLSAHMKEYQQDRALNEDYVHAREAAQISELIRKELQERNQNDKSHLISANTPANETYLTDFEKQWNEKYQIFDNETEKRRNALLNSQKEEMDAFEKKWSEEMPRRYRKPSNQLLELKQTERNFALSGNFDEAERLHADVENLAKQEAEIIQKRIIRDYQKAKLRLSQRLQEELEKYDSSRQTSRKLIDIEKQKAYEREQRRDNVIKEKQRLAEQNSREKSGKISQEFAANVEHEQTNNIMNILPEIVPPNDPKFIEEDQKRKREKRKQQEEFQRKNAAKTLLEYSNEFSDGEKLNPIESENLNSTKSENLIPIESENLNSSKPENLNSIEQENINSVESEDLNTTEPKKEQDNQCDPSKKVGVLIDSLAKQQSQVENEEFSDEPKKQNFPNEIPMQSCINQMQQNLTK